jgi:hypothetical protein
LAFFLLLTYLALSFLRPGELYPGLARFELMDVATVLAGLGAVGALFLGRGPTFRVPQPLVVAAFTVWAMFSVVAALRWPGGALGTLLSLAPSVAVFLLLYFNLDTYARVRTTCATLSLLAVVTAAQSVVSYHTGWRSETFLYEEWESVPEGESGFDRAAEDDGPESAEGGVGPGPGRIARIRSLGFLSDPNDLAQALVSILPMLFALREPARRVRNALLVWLPAAGLLYTIALTRSRGVIPALGLLLFLAFRRRLGNTLSLTVGVLGGGAAIFIGFTGGRALSIDESAEGRLEAWAAGLQMLKSSPLWGVGHGSFTDHHPLVAHNSFVHCFAETGMVGYFLWLALSVLTLRGLKRVQKSAPKTNDGGETRRWAHAAELALAAFLTGAFFLSRSYGVMLFLLLGLGTAIIDISSREEWSEPDPGVLTWVPAVGFLAVVSVFCFWLVLQILT